MQQPEKHISWDEMQRLTGTPWFRRRSDGLGWKPVTWQGWLVTVVAAGSVVGVLALLRGSSARVPVVIVIIAVYSRDRPSHRRRTGADGQQPETTDAG